MEEGIDRIEKVARVLAIIMPVGKRKKTVKGIMF
jgi:hypothetical protein